MNATESNPGGGPEPARAKWEQELEQILAAADREPTSIDKARGKVLSARYQAPAQVRHTRQQLGTRLTTTVWVGIFLALVLGAWLLGHFSPLLGRVSAIAAVGLLVALVLRGLFRPARKDSGDDNPSAQSWKNRLFDRDPPR